jgi:hypothetical protein
MMHTLADLNYYVLQSNVGLEIANENEENGQSKRYGDGKRMQEHA